MKISVYRDFRLIMTLYGNFGSICVRDNKDNPSEVNALIALYLLVHFTTFLNALVNTYVYTHHTFMKNCIVAIKIKMFR